MEPFAILFHDGPKGAAALGGQCKLEAAPTTVILLPSYLERRSKPFLFMLSLLLVAAFGLVDWLSGPEVYVHIIYLVPIALAAWHIGQRAGAFISLSAALVWLWADWGAGHLYSHPAIPFWNDAMHLLAFLLFGYLVSAFREALHSARRQATRDPLTGLLNKRAFAKAAERELKRSRRYRHPLGLLFLDLDHFKEVNDTLGHAAGDAVLRCVAFVMKADLRDTDVLARMGGDEFVALLVESGPDATERAVANLRQRLLGAMAEMESPVTFSIGVVSFPRAPGSIDAMVDAADRLMYRVKQEGRNAVRHELADDAS